MQTQKLDLTTIKIDELINFTQAMIQFDNNELINSAKEITAKYQNLIVTEDIIPAVKKEVAGLNKIVTQLEEQRKLIKSEYNQPYSKFEKKIKEVTEIINTTTLSLKGQISEFEKKEREQKLVKIKELIADTVIDYNLNEKYAPKLIIVDKFLNVSETFPKIKKAIEDQAIQLLEAQENEKKAIELQAKLERMKQVELERRIVERKDLIQKLNEKYQLEVTYNEVRHLPDIKVYEHFETLHIKEISKSFNQSIAEKPQEQIIEPVVQPTPQIQKVAPTININNSAKKIEPTVTITPPPTCWKLTIKGLSKVELDEIIGGIEEYYPHATILNVE